MKLDSCTFKQHGNAVREILNEAILNSTAVYDYQPRDMEAIRHWFEAKRSANFPVIGAFAPTGKLLGFASYGAFRSWPAYKYSIEHSIYIHHEHRGQGLGTSLMQKLIDTALQQQYHVMVGGIDESNSASISLHIKLGFSHAGTVRQAGFKFGRWLDLTLYQRILTTPVSPTDG